MTSSIWTSKSVPASTILLFVLCLVNFTTATLSQGCTHPWKSPISWRPKANESRIFQVGLDRDDPREIRVRIPPNYNGSDVMLPLVLAYHDKDQTTAEMEYESRLSDPSINEEFIIVYPTAKNDTWQSDISVRRWQKKMIQPKNVTDDIAFTTQLLDDLETVICFNTAKVHAVGLGTGAGMVHLLACDPQLSTRIASFGTVAGGFGHPSKGAPWNQCTPSRGSLPIISIHGEDDKVLPYLLNEWEAAKSRQAIPAWLDDWSERNGCGYPTGDVMVGRDGTGTKVEVTKLDGGGWSSEGDAFDGGALRIAKSCPVQKEKTDNDLPTEDKNKDSDADGPKEQVLSSNPADFTLLHYRVKNYGHGWPTLQIKKSRSSKVQERLFDATSLILDWFKIHQLPIEWAGRNEKGEKGETEEEIRKRLLKEYRDRKKEEEKKEEEEEEEEEEEVVLEDANSDEKVAGKGLAEDDAELEVPDKIEVGDKVIGKDIPEEEANEVFHEEVEKMVEEKEEHDEL